ARDRAADDDALEACERASASGGVGSRNEVAGADAAQPLVRANPDEPVARLGALHDLAPLQLRHRGARRVRPLGGGLAIRWCAHPDRMPPAPCGSCKNVRSECSDRVRISSHWALPDARSAPGPRPGGVAPALFALLGAGAALAAVATLESWVGELPAAILLYLVPVILAASRWGRGPAVGVALA